MNQLAIKDLKAPKLVRETLATYGSALVTNNGRPMAMLIDIQEGETPEELSKAISLARGRLALTSLRAASRRKGLDSMTGDEIDAEIKAARKVRSQSNANRSV